MQSKTSFFSTAIFNKNISRFYLLALFYLAAQCVALPLTLSTSLGYKAAGLEHAQLMYDAVRTIYFSTQITAIISFAGACAAGMAVFSYLFSAKSANMIASLPIKREAMFISSVAAVYAVVIVSNIISALFAFGVTMPLGLMLGKWIIQWFGIVMVQFTLFFGIAVFCAVVTGSILAMPAIYIVVNFAAVVLAQVFSSIISDVMFGINASIPQFVYKLSPIVHFFNSSAVFYNGDNAFDNVSYNLMSYGYSDILLWYILAGVVFLGLAFFAHRHRHMETAGDVVSLRLLNPVFKVLFTLGCGYCAGYLFYAMFLDYSTGNEAAKIIVCIAIFSLIGYVLADMMVKKSTRISIKHAATPAIILAVLLAGSVWISEADIFGREAYVPAPSAVNAASLSVNGEHVQLDSTEGIGWITALHQTVLDNRAVHENGKNMSQNYIYINYELKDGSILSRQYLTRTTDENKSSDEAMLMNTIMNRTESILYRKQTSIPVTPLTISSGSIYALNKNGEWAYMNFTPDEIYELYSQCIFPDMQDGTIGLLNLGADTEFEFYDNQIEIYLYRSVKNSDNDDAVESEYFFTFPTNKSARTNIWLQEHGITVSKTEDSSLSTKPGMSVRYN